MSSIRRLTAMPTPLGWFIVKMFYILSEFCIKLDFGCVFVLELFAIRSICYCTQIDVLLLRFVNIIKAIGNALELQLNSTSKEIAFYSNQ